MRPALRTFLFCAPLAVLFGVPAVLLWLAGEFTQPETVITRQLRHDRLVLHAPAYSAPTTYKKNCAIQQLRPRVLTLGTSRVLQFRSGFFRPGTSFYNGGSCIQRVQHFRWLLDRLPRQDQPELLILGLDQYWFNGNSGYAKPGRPEWFEAQLHTHSTPFEIFRANWWQTYKDVAAGKIQRRLLFSLRGLDDRVGLTALMLEEGHRNDGSYRYRDYEQDITDPRHPDRNLQKSLKNIAKNIVPFEWSATVHELSVREMDSFLQECQERGITVVAFLPPYPHVIWEKMQSMGEKYAYLSLLEPALRPLFDRRGFELYDFSDFATLGATDTEAIDGYHGSEKVYLRLMLAMLKSGSCLNRYADAGYLESVLAAATASRDLVPETFSSDRNVPSAAKITKSRNTEIGE